MSQKTGPCKICLSARPLYAVGMTDLNRGVCEPCADRMIDCPHEEVTRVQCYDADGCGYYVSRCLECGFEEHDTLS